MAIRSDQREKLSREDTDGNREASATAEAVDQALSHPVTSFNLTALDRPPLAQANAKLEVVHSLL